MERKKKEEKREREERYLILGIGSLNMIKFILGIGKWSIIINLYWEMGKW